MSIGVEGDAATLELGAKIALLAVGETESCVDLIGRATVYRGMTPIPHVELLSMHFEGWYFAISKAPSANFTASEVVGVGKCLEQENVWYLHVRIHKKSGA